MASLHGVHGAAGARDESTRSTRNPEWSDPGPASVLVGRTPRAQGQPGRAPPAPAGRRPRPLPRRPGRHRRRGRPRRRRRGPPRRHDRRRPRRRPVGVAAPLPVLRARTRSRCSRTEPTMGDRVLVAGVGNIFNGDDGFGSAVVGQLLAGPVPAGARVVDYGIRGVHLAFDLADGVETLILVDTVPDAGGGPGSVAVLEVPAGSVRDGGVRRPRPRSRTPCSGRWARSATSCRGRWSSAASRCRSTTGSGSASRWRRPCRSPPSKVLELLRQELEEPG